MNSRVSVQPGQACNFASVNNGYLQGLERKAVVSWWRMHASLVTYVNPEIPPTAVVGL